MKNHLAALAVLITCIYTASSTRAADEFQPQELMSIAKMAGACGIMDSMIQLQSTTKMPGGDDFVARFWSVEAARLGMTVQQLSDTCNKSIEAYNRFWEAAESLKK